MRFDWYQATIPERPTVLAEALLERLAAGGSIEVGRGRHNYHQSFTVRSPEGTRRAVVLAGGPNGDPNVTASGEGTPAFVELVRASWPVHRVTRFDAAEDFAQEGAYERLEATMRAIAVLRGVKGRAIVPDDPTDGRTYYLGAPSSDVRVRLYDKAAEVRRSIRGPAVAAVPEHWTRLEAQVRPVKDWRHLAAQMPPEAVWGMSGWTRQLAREAMALDIPRCCMQAGRQEDMERSYRAMLDQYGRVLRWLHRDAGDWSCVGLQIGHDLAEAEGWRARKH